MTCFDAHSDLLYDVTRRRLTGETRVLERIHLPQLRRGGVEGLVLALWTSTASGETFWESTDLRKPEQALERTWRMLALSWGVQPQMCEEVPSTDVLFYTAKKAARDYFRLSAGEEIIITGGITNGRSGTTNLLKVETI